MPQQPLHDFFAINYASQIQSSNIPIPALTWQISGCGVTKIVNHFETNTSMSTNA